MKVKLILTICLITAVGSTYAVTGSLWGDIDQPMMDSKDAVQEQIKTEKELEEKIREQNKTVCDVLMEQTRLDHNALNNPELLGIIRTTIARMPDEFKPLVATEGAMDKLYEAYRAKYIKTYCTK